jgi:hypothetical protein
MNAQRLALPAAGEKQVQKWKTAKAQNQLQKRGESQPSGARFVGRFSLLIMGRALGTCEAGRLGVVVRLSFQLAFSTPSSERLIITRYFPHRESSWH